MREVLIANKAVSVENVLKLRLTDRALLALYPGSHVYRADSRLLSALARSTDTDQRHCDFL